MIMIIKKHVHFLKEKIRNNENICILGDYDVDGCM